MENKISKNIKILEERIRSAFPTTYDYNLELYTGDRDIFLSEIKKDDSLNYYPDEQLNEAIDYILEYYKIGVCVKCNKIAKGRHYNYQTNRGTWGPGYKNWTAKVCLDCATRVIECAECGSIRVLCRTHFDYDKGEYTGVCVKCAKMELDYE